MWRVADDTPNRRALAIYPTDSAGFAPPSPFPFPALHRGAAAGEDGGKTRDGGGRQTASAAGAGTGLPAGAEAV